MHSIHVSVLVVAYFQIICCHYVDGRNIVQFTYHLTTGAFWVADADKCTNVPEKMSNHITALNANGCVRLYDEINCDGASIELLPHSPARADLRVWEFDNMAKSVGPCRNICEPEVFGATLPSVDVDIYAGKNLVGTNAKIRVVGCTPIPQNLIDKVLSINTRMYCIKLYNNFNCESDNTSGYDTKMIELRLGTPSHRDLTQWNFPQIRAISHCSYRCPTGWAPATTESSINNKTTIQPENESNLHLKSNEIPPSSKSAEILWIVIFIQIMIIIGCVVFFFWMKNKMQVSTNGYHISWGKSEEKLNETGFENMAAGNTSKETFDDKNIL